MQGTSFLPRKYSENVRSLRCKITDEISHMITISYKTKTGKSWRGNDWCQLFATNIFFELFGLVKSKSEVLQIPNFFENKKSIVAYYGYV